jgi:hypothetical protein
LAQLGDASIRPIPASVGDEALRCIIGRDEGGMFAVPDYVPEDADDE